MMLATLLEPDEASLQAALREVESIADAFEIRFDAFKESVDPRSLRRLTKKPLVATCRRKEEGGHYRGTEEVRLALLERAAEAGFEIVDVEGPTQLPLPDERLIRSIHDYEATPDVEELVRRGQLLGRNGAHVKIATRVQHLGDSLALLEATRRLQREGISCSLMGLGDFPRLLAHLVGSRFTYGGARNPAPYQPRLVELRATWDHWGNPAPAENLYLVVGSPSAHSLSPKLHNTGFRTLSIAAAYGALEVRTKEELRLLISHASALGLKGASITAPLKEAAFELAPEHTPEAQRARSSNCLRFDGERVTAHNTDGLGAAHVLKRLLPKGKPKVMLLGTGGAARGLVANVPNAVFTVSGRNPPKMRELAEEFRLETMPIELVRRLWDDYDAIVNATGVENPLSLVGFRGAVFDLHYADQATAWELKAKELGLRFAGGRELLLEQGLQAFEFWTGEVAPRAAMAAALGVVP